MITILVDHNIEGQPTLLLRALESQGWVDLGLLQVATFRDLSLPIDSSDREIWRFVQEHGMLLLTGNRNMIGEDSLQQTLRDENRPESIPVITIANVNRVRERNCREECATRLAEICSDVESYLGTGRLFIP